MVSMDLPMSLMGILKPRSIAKIVYAPRNRDNFIRKEDR